MLNCFFPRGDLSKDDRRAWLDAFQCLLTKPSKLSPTDFPGAKSRYDDFVVVHMNQTLSIHGTVSHRPFHRIYTSLILT
jgi:tyrosinase